MSGFDDALDAFGVHAIGGIIGGLSTGFFATDQVASPFSYGGKRREDII
jgi:ammonium transporter, Amt family